MEEGRRTRGEGRRVKEPKLRSAEGGKDRSRRSEVGDRRTEKIDGRGRADRARWRRGRGASLEVGKTEAGDRKSETKDGKEMEEPKYRSAGGGRQKQRSEGRRHGVKTGRRKGKRSMDEGGTWPMEERFA